MELATSVKNPAEALWIAEENNQLVIYVHTLFSPSFVILFMFHKFCSLGFWDELFSTFHIQVLGLKKTDKYVIATTNREEIKDDKTWGETKQLHFNGDFFILLKGFMFLYQEVTTKVLNMLLKKLMNTIALSHCYPFDMLNCKSTIKPNPISQDLNELSECQIKVVMGHRISECLIVSLLIELLHNCLYFSVFFVVIFLVKEYKHV